MPVKDMKDLKFERLTVISRSGSDPDGNALWLCRCICGKHKKIKGVQLRNRSVKSCGCLARDINSSQFIKHGKTDHKLYDVWQAMKQRCNNSNHDSYHNYGGRGIKVCSLWEDFVEFFNWAISNGWREGLQLDRENNNGDYEPSNCRFISQQINIRNSRRRRVGKSGLIGVSLTKDGNWRARVVIGGVEYSLGRYNTAEEAATIRDEIIIKCSLPLFLNFSEADIDTSEEINLMDCIIKLKEEIKRLRIK